MARRSVEKSIDWRGSSYRDLLDFPKQARRDAGYQLSQVQHDLEPDDWKPFDAVGSGVKEIIVNVSEGWFRVMYAAKFAEAVYVLHCFQKKSNKTSDKDKDIAAQRYRAVISERKSRT